MSLQFELGLKKVVIAFTPNKTLGEGLAEFCKQQGFDPSQFCLKKGKQNLDLSLTYRLSGLAARASVEVVRLTAAESAAKGEVSIGLQLSNGTRLVAKFPPSASLWDILIHWEKTNNINLTRDSDQKNGTFLQPCVQYLNKDIDTSPALRLTTLQTIGLTQGNGLLRFQQRFTDIPLEKALAIDVAAQEEEKTLKEKDCKEFEEKKEKRLKDAKEREELEKASREREAKALEEERKRKAQLESTIQKDIEEEEKKKLKEVELREMERVQQEREEQIKFERAKKDREREELERQRQYQEFLKTADTKRKEKAAAASSSASSSQAPSTPSEPNLKREPVEAVAESQAIKKQKLDDGSSSPKAYDRNIQVFAPSSTPFDPRTIELPDDFFEPTSEDLARAMEIEKQLRKEQERENSTLRTREQREKDRLRKLSKYKKCLIRVRLPDRTELQATFLPSESITVLYSVVQNTLRLTETNTPLPFYLFITPPFQRLDITSDRPLRDLGLLPAALVHLGIEDGVNARTPFLKDDIIVEIREKLLPSATYTSKKELTFVTNDEKDEKAEKKEPKPEAPREDKPLTEQEKDKKLKNLLFGKKK